MWMHPAILQAGQCGMLGTEGQENAVPTDCPRCTHPVRTPSWKGFLRRNQPHLQQMSHARAHAQSLSPSVIRHFGAAEDIGKQSADGFDVIVWWLCGTWSESLTTHPSICEGSCSVPRL